MPDLVLVGAVESTRVALEAAHRAEGWRVRALVTLPPESCGRHSDYCDLTPQACGMGIEVIHAARINDAAVIARIGALRPDLILVVGWSQICGPDFLAISPGRVLGYHPAPLPRLRGRAVIPWTILLREPVSAGTLFWIDGGTDSGAVLEQEFFLVAPDETARSLYDRHMEVLASMLPKALRRIGQGDAAGIPQKEHLATFAARRTKADGLIAWSQGTDAIERLIRAVGRPYPGAFTHLGSDSITIWAAVPGPPGSYEAALPGQIVATAPSYWLVRTGDGLLRVTEWEQTNGGDLSVHRRLG